MSVAQSSPDNKNTKWPAALLENDGAFVTASYSSTPSYRVFKANFCARPASAPGHDILRLNFEAFVLIFPNERGIVVEEEGKDFAREEAEMLFRLGGGFLESIIVIAGAAHLAFVVMRDGVIIGVFFSPWFNFFANQCGKIIKLDGAGATMLAKEAGVKDVSGEKWQDWRTATFCGGKSGRAGGHALVPNVAIITEFGRRTVSAYQWMRHSPDASFELTQSLGEPPGQSQVIELFEGLLVFVPEFFGRIGHVTMRCDKVAWQSAANPGDSHQLQGGHT